MKPTECDCCFEPLGAQVYYVQSDDGYDTFAVCSPECRDLLLGDDYTPGTNMTAIEAADRAAFDEAMFGD